MRKRLAIIATHPVHYNAPWFRMLAETKGIEVKVFYTYSQRKSDHYDEDFGIDIKWDIPLLNGYDYEWIENISKHPGLKNFFGIKCPGLIPAIERWNATHIFVFGWNYHTHFKAMRYFKGKIPVLFRGDSTLLDYDYKNINDILNDFNTSSLRSYIKFKLRKIFLTHVYKHIDTALYVGKNNKDYYLAHGLKEDQLVFAPHAIDNERFFDNEERQYETKAKKWKKQLGITPDDFVILFCGKFEPKKNPVLLLNAYFKLKQENPELKIKLIFAGNGVLEDELKELAGPDKNIIFIPFQNQSQMPVVYRLADVYCLPSQGPGETWGLAVNEALACGCPVIVSDKVGCAADLVSDKTGYIFSSNNIRSLSGSILKSISKTPDTEELQKQISNWSFDNISSTILKVVSQY